MFTRGESAALLCLKSKLFQIHQTVMAANKACQLNQSQAVGSKIQSIKIVEGPVIAYELRLEAVTLVEVFQIILLSPLR